MPKLCFRFFEPGYIQGRGQIWRSISGVSNNAEKNKISAKTSAIKPMMVKGIRNIRKPVGKWPVATPDGMKAWAIIMEKAKMIIRGKNIHSNVNQL